MIPRHVLVPEHAGSYRLAAFLNQPIIPHGHHQDCADGLDVLERVASSINSLGRVVWGDMASLSRSNYLTRRTDGSLAVRMLARRVTLPPDEGVKEIVVERPWIPDDGTDEPLISMQGDRVCHSLKCGRQSPALPLQWRGSMELISPAPGAVNYQQTEPPRFRVWPRIRRLLCETRDRMAPLGARICRKRRA